MATVYSYEKSAKLKSAIITVLVAICVIALLFLLAFRPPYPPIEPEGLLIDFGQDVSGMGSKEPRLVNQVPVPPVESDNAVVEKEVATQDMEQTVAIPKNKKNETQVTHNKNQTDKPVETNNEPVIDNSQVYNPNNHSFENQNDSEGNKPGSGNMGDPSGNPEGNQGKGDGIGDNGDSGIGYSLSGRSMTKKPNIAGNPTESGKVVLNIKVNRDGVVTEASYERKGSTIVDQKVISDAIRSIKGKKLFNVKSDAPAIQEGTLTINYTLK